MPQPSDFGELERWKRLETGRSAPSIRKRLATHPSRLKR